MTNSTLQEVYCVVGIQVAGDPTQYMMEQAFARADLECKFVTFEIDPENLESAIAGIRALGINGAKLGGALAGQATNLVDRISETARLAGEVNLIRRQSDQLHGDSTVGKGLVGAVRELIELEGKHFVVLGAGSAARGAAVELAAVGVAEITIVSRSIEQGEQVATILSDNTKTTARAVHWTSDFIPDPSTAAIINATSIGAEGDNQRVPLNLESLPKSCTIVDMASTSTRTLLLRSADEMDLATKSGLDVLLHQTAIAFHVWTGHDPDLRALRDALEEYLMV